LFFFGFTVLFTENENFFVVAQPEVRLGKNGIEEIKQHPFFKSVDWDKVERGETTGPKPICKATLNKEMEYLNKPKPSAGINSPPQ